MAVENEIDGEIAWNHRHADYTIQPINMCIDAKI